MEGADTAFFYTAWSCGLNNTVISLVEHHDLDWIGRRAYLTAKAEKRKTELYTMDLIWMLVNSKYENFNSPMPSDIECKKVVRDKRSAKEIKKGILRKLGVTS